MIKEEELPPDVGAWASWAACPVAFPAVSRWRARWHYRWRGFGPASSAEGLPFAYPRRRQRGCREIIRQVTPIYPPIAKTAHISGTVVLHAIIAKDGTIQELTYISGPPLLMRNAMDAVRQWRYNPTLLNGEPVEVDTTISVVFTLGG